MKLEEDIATLVDGQNHLSGKSFQKVRSPVVLSPEQDLHILKELLAGLFRDFGQVLQQRLKPVANLICTAI